MYAIHLLVFQNKLKALTTIGRLGAFFNVQIQIYSVVKPIYIDQTFVTRLPMSLRMIRFGYARKRKFCVRQ